MNKPSCRNPTCSLPGKRRVHTHHPATDSTEPRPENGGATDASGADRRSRRQEARRTTVSSTAERHSTRSSHSASRASACPRSPVSNGWPGTPSPAGSSARPRCVANLAAAGPPASSPKSYRPTRSARSPGGRGGRRAYARAKPVRKAKCVRASYWAKDSTPGSLRRTRKQARPSGYLRGHPASSGHQAPGRQRQGSPQGQGLLVAVRLRDATDTVGRCRERVQRGEP